MGRNLLLNWIVLLPLLVSAMLVPRFQFALIHVIESDQSASALRVALTPGQLRALLFESARFWTPVAASLSYAVAFAYIAANLPSYGNRGGTQRQFLMWCLVPLCLGTLALNDFLAMWDLQIGKPLVAETATANDGVRESLDSFAVVEWHTVGLRPAVFS